MRNISIKIHYSWFFVFFLIFYTLSQYYFPSFYPGWTTGLYWFIGVLATVFIFLSVLIHEISHALVGQRYGLKTRNILFFLFGGITEMEKEPSTPQTEIKMSLVGPLASLFLAILFWFSSLIPGNVSFKAISEYLFIVNLMLLIFNLIPIFPLDGGRILRSIIWVFVKKLRKATAIAVFWSRALTILLIGFGVFQAFQENYLGGIWLIFVGFFLIQAGEASYRQLTMREVLSKIPVSKIIERKVQCILPNTTVQRLCEEHFLEYKQSGFIICQGSSLSGIVTIEDIKRVPKKQRSRKKVFEIMTSVGSLLKVQETETAYDALTKMISHDLSRLPVISKEGKLLGLVTKNSILFLLALES